MPGVSTASGIASARSKSYPHSSQNLPLRSASHTGQPAPVAAEPPDDGADPAPTETGGAAGIAAEGAATPGASPPITSPQVSQ
jgi:hypothetical protein